MPKPVSICLVLPSLKMGGMERVMTRLATDFCNRSGVRVSLLVMTRAPHFYQIDDRVHLYEPPFVFDTRKRMRENLRTVRWVRKTLKELNPDAILSFGEMYNAFLLMSAWKLGKRVFVSDRSKPDKRWGRFHETMRRVFYPTATGIIAQTSYAKAFMERETGHKNVRVIPNPIQPPHLSDQPREKAILSVGRLVGLKRTDLLIDIFAALPERAGWKLWIVGDGPEREKLESQVRDKNLQEEVIFWGGRNDVEDFYNRAGIFAFTSTSEGFPNVLLEAMAHGMPAVSFDCVAGPSDLISNGSNGYLVPLLDQEAMTERLTQLMQQPELRNVIGQAARETSRRYEQEQIAEQFYNFLIG